MSEMDRKANEFLREHLPQIFKNFKPYMDDIKQGCDVLDECGYGHTKNIWTKEAFSIFSNLTTLEPAMTNMLYSMTREDWFQDRIMELIQNSSILQHRKDIMRKALESHNNREYLISIPLLFTQIEGIMGDALVLNNLAIKKMGSFLPQIRQTK